MGTASLEATLGALGDSPLEIAQRSVRYLEGTLIDRLKLSEVRALKVKPARLTLMGQTPAGKLAIKIYSPGYRPVVRRLMRLQPWLEDVTGAKLVEMDMGEEVHEAYGVNSLAWEWYEGLHFNGGSSKTTRQLMAAVARLHEKQPGAGADRTRRQAMPWGVEGSAGEDMPLEWGVESFFADSERNLGRLMKALPRAERGGGDEILEVLECAALEVFRRCGHLSLIHRDLTFSNILTGDDETIRLIDFDRAGFAPFPFELADVALRQHSLNDVRLLIGSGLEALSDASAQSTEPMYLRHRGEDARAVWQATRGPALLWAYAKTVGSQLAKLRRRAKLDRSGREELHALAIRARQELFGQIGSRW